MADPQVAVTLGALLRSAQARGLARLDAQLLLGHLLQRPRTWLLAHDDAPLAPALHDRWHALVEQRLDQVPLAYLTGNHEFFGLPLHVTRDVLDPRPDTETLVDWALHCLTQAGTEHPRVADLGTGSGAILLALMSALPEITALGLDLSEEAATTARDNAERLGFADRSLFLRGDWSQALAQVDVLVSNPPYIRSEVIAGLARDVRDYDPMLALDGGADGLDAYRVIIADLPRVLAPGGAAFFEVGYDQHESVSALLKEAGFDVRLHRDLAGIDRVVEAERGAIPEPQGLFG